MRVVIIGGVAAGMSAASQARRARPDAEIVVLEKTQDVSYGACGLPYKLLPDTDMDDLLVISAQHFREERNIDAPTSTSTRPATASTRSMPSPGNRSGFRLHWTTPSARRRQRSKGSEGPSPGTPTSWSCRIWKPAICSPKALPS